MKFLRNLKKHAVAVSALGLGSLSAFAEGEATVDTTIASNALTTMVESVKTYIAAAAPTLVALLMAALAVTLIWVAFKWIRKGTNKAS